MFQFNFHRQVIRFARAEDWAIFLFLLSLPDTRRFSPRFRFSGALSFPYSMVVLFLFGGFFY